MDYQNRLCKILSKPGNQVCADCNSKNPRWASISLGVFVCIRCCGIHRSLGTHISKMKSTTLDKWTLEMLSLFESIDNNVANTYWEASFNVSSKPVEASPTHTVENFIQNKYKHKCWVANGPDPVTQAFQPKPAQSIPKIEPKKMHHSATVDLIGPEIVTEKFARPLERPILNTAAEIDIFADDSKKNHSFGGESAYKNASLFESLQFVSVIPKSNVKVIEKNKEIVCERPKNIQQDDEKSQKINQVLSMYGNQQSNITISGKNNSGFQPLGAIAAQNFFNQVHRPNASYPSF